MARSTSPFAALRIAPLCALLALCAAARQPDPAAVSGDFSERIAVDVVNVEVYVTDEEGEPVVDLTRDDFVVTEDGRPVEVINFYRVSGGRPSPVTIASAPPRGDEPAGEARSPSPLPPPGEEIAVPESQRLHLVIYVDNFNINPLNRNRVFGRLHAFLRDTVRGGDQVMVATYDRSLHIRQPFTGSADAVSKVLYELEGLSGSAVERESERSDALREIYETDSEHKARFRAKQFAENQYHEIEGALDALREMLDSLAGLPGRKMLIHLSDGIPMVPGQDLYQAIQQRFADISALGEAFSRDLSRQYLELIAHANSNRVSFYTIDAGGLRTRSWMGAENRTVNNQVPVSMAVDGVRASNLQGTLRMMANRTGGRSILNTNDVTRGLAGISQDLANYYSLGYRAPITDRGRYHRIAVRLAEERDGWRLRHREGYRDKSLEARMQDGIRAFLIHGYATNPLGVSIEIGEERAAADGMAVVPVRVRIPMENVVLIPREAFYEGRLRVYFGATDERGREAAMEELPFELRIPASAVDLARRDEVARVIDLKMRPGPHKLVVAVRDEIGEERSVVGRYVSVDGPEGGDEVLPPALDPGG